uniref:Uncharacterized protein n=1 Tax=viral metagenome TaxID=1070528 RepID=A0A6C0IEB7_9ZZZZ
MSYLDANELIFNNDIEKGIHTGGFSVNSIMMKEGISPIMTINNNQKGGTQLVSDLFNDMAVPNWALSYHNKMFGGEYKNIISDSDDEDDNKIVNDDLHDKLVDLVKQHDLQQQNKQIKKKNTRKMQSKKGGTKKRKLI